MRRQALALMLAAMTAGCMSTDGNMQLGDNPGCVGCQGNYGRSMGPPRLQCLQDGYGNSVPLQGIWAANPPGNNYIAQQMMKNSIGLNELDFYDPKTLDAMNTALALNSPAKGGMPPRPFPKEGLIVPRGLPVAPGFAPSDVMQAGFTAGQSSPQNSNRGYFGYNNPYGYGYPYYGYSYYGYYNPYYGQGGDARASNGEVIYAEIRTDGSTGDGVRQAQYMQPSAGAGYSVPTSAAVGSPYWPPTPYGGMPQGWCPNPGYSVPVGGQRMQIQFTKPSMKIYWVGRTADGRETFSKFPLETPGSYNFLQGAMYRLKLTNIENRPNLELYPTLEVMPVNCKTQEFVSHSAIPLQFTDEDFKHVTDGNYLVKVIYFPDPRFQAQFGAGPGEILSTLLEAGTDPVKEAQKRGTVLLIIRMGNVKQELTHTPPLNTPGGGPAGPAVNPGCPPGISAGPACPPAGPGWPPGGPGCPPTGAFCPPGGCYPGMMPPTVSLGGADQGPNFLNMPPLPQLPYMYWPYGPYANSPWCGPGYCAGGACPPPGWNTGGAPYPPYGQYAGARGVPSAPGMAPNPGPAPTPGVAPNPAMNPNPVPPQINYGTRPAEPQGISTVNPPHRFTATDLPAIPDDKKPATTSELPPAGSGPPSALAAPANSANLPPAAAPPSFPDPRPRPGFPLTAPPNEPAKAPVPNPVTPAAPNRIDGPETPNAPLPPALEAPSPPSSSGQRMPAAPAVQLVPPPGPRPEDGLPAPSHSLNGTPLLSPPPDMSGPGSPPSLSPPASGSGMPGLPPPSMPVPPPTGATSPLPGPAASSNPSLPIPAMEPGASERATVRPDLANIPLPGSVSPAAPAFPRVASMPNNVQIGNGIGPNSDSNPVPPVLNPK